MASGKVEMNEMLAKLRAKYVEELPDKLDRIEDVAMDISQGKDREGNQLELYRRVHSLKGSAGSYGVPIVSAICHRFEDRISEDQEDVTEGDRSFIDDALAYIDLLREAGKQVAAGQENLAGTEAKLAALASHTPPEAPNVEGAAPARVSILLVDDIKTTAMMLRAACKEDAVDLARSDTDIDALDRMMAERFDVVICGLGGGRIGGLGLIAALKLSRGASRDAATVLLTADPLTVPKTTPGPDKVLTRGPDMLVELKTLVDAVRANKEGPSS